MPLQPPPPQQRGSHFLFAPDMTETEKQTIADLVPYMGRVARMDTDWDPIDIIWTGYVRRGVLGVNSPLRLMCWRRTRHSNIWEPPVSGIQWTPDGRRSLTLLE